MSATRKTDALCKKCNKLPGKILCTGCEGNFCKGCDQHHYKEIEQDFNDRVIVQHDNLLEKLEESKPKSINDHPLIAEINNWESDMIEKVRTTASNTRAELNKIVNEDLKNISKDFKGLTEEIRSLKETRNYVETDIEELLETIKKLRLDLQGLTKPTSITINTNQTAQINWSKLIFIENRQQKIAPTQGRNSCVYSSEKIYLFICLSC